MRLLQSFTVESPCGGETWYKGKKYMIRWRSSGIRGNVTIKLKWGTGSGGWYTIARNASNNGQYSYRVLTTIGYNGDQFTIHVSTLDGKITGTSPKPFSILTPPDLAIVDARFQPFPNGRKLVVEIVNLEADVRHRAVQARVIGITTWTPHPLINEKLDWILTLKRGQRKPLVLDIKQPEPIDAPELHVGIEIDWRDRIPESNEQNNAFEKVIKLPCGIRITRLSKSKVKLGEEFTMYGRFGHHQATKRVYIEQGNKRYKIINYRWKNDAITCYVPPDVEIYGRCSLVVYYTDPALGKAMKSNTVPLHLNVKITGDVDWPGETEKLDSRKVADALVDEFDWLDYGSSWKPKVEILNLWVERCPSMGNASMYRLCCKFRKNFEHIHLVSFEILKGGMELPLYLICKTWDIEKDEGNDSYIARKDVPGSLSPASTTSSVTSLKNGTLRGITWLAHPSR